MTMRDILSPLRAALATPSGAVLAVTAGAQLSIPLAGAPYMASVVCIVAAIVTALMQWNQGRNGRVLVAAVCLAVAVVYVVVAGLPKLS